MAHLPSFFGKPQTASALAMIATGISLSVALGIVPGAKHPNLSVGQGVPVERPGVPVVQAPAEAEPLQVDGTQIRELLAEELSNPRPETVRALKRIADLAASLPTDPTNMSAELHPPEQVNSPVSAATAFAELVQKHGLMVVLTPEEIFGDQLALGNRAAEVAAVHGVFPEFYNRVTSSQLPMAGRAIVDTVAAIAGISGETAAMELGYVQPPPTTKSNKRGR